MAAKYHPEMTLAQRSIVYLFSRFIIHTYRESNWHKIMSEYLKSGFDLDLDLESTDCSFSYLLKLSSKTTGTPIGSMKKIVPILKNRT